MNREDYNRCLSEKIKSDELKGLPQTVKFCSASKLCTSKAKDTEEAKQICSLPKEPRTPKKTAHQKQKEQEACDPEVFFEVASQFKNLYIHAHGEHCAPCKDLDNRIKEADIPHQIVNVPETCIEILDQLGIMAFPTVAKMSKGKIVSQHVGNPAEIIEKMKRGE